MLQIILAQYTLTMQISSICRSCTRHALRMRMSSRESVRLELSAGAVVLQFKQLIETIHHDASALGTSSCDITCDGQYGPVYAPVKYKTAAVHGELRRSGSRPSHRWYRRGPGWRVKHSFTITGFHYAVKVFYIQLYSV